MFRVFGEIKIVCKRESVCASVKVCKCVCVCLASTHTHRHAVGLGNYNSSSFPLCAHVENKARKGNNEKVCVCGRAMPTENVQGAGVGGILGVHLSIKLF